MGTESASTCSTTTAPARRRSGELAFYESNSNRGDALALYGLD